MNLNWGIVGLGKIAVKFAEDIQLAPGNTIYAVASRSDSKAEEFKLRFNATKAYGSYYQLFDDDDVDIVYIATPHHLHVELSIHALQCGKHVLCEKPASLNVNDLAKLIQVHRSSSCFFMEALWSRFNSAIVKAKELVDAGSIGELKYINADFCFKAKYDSASRLFNRSLGGGALLDIGLYPVFLSYLFLGIPKVIKATANYSDTDVDMQTAVLMHYEDAHAVLYAAFDVTSKMDARLYGSDGSISFNGRWHESDGFLIVNSAGSEEMKYPLNGNGYINEIIACREAILQGQKEHDDWTLADSLALAEILEVIKEQIGLRYQ